MTQPLQNIILNTMIQPVLTGSRKLAHTVIPVDWLKHLLDLTTWFDNEVAFGTGLLFSGVERGYCDLFVADSNATLVELQSEFQTYVQVGKEDPAQLPDLTVKHQQNIGRLFGYSEEFLPLSPVYETTPNPATLEVDPVFYQIMPLDQQSIDTLSKLLNK